MRVHGKEYGVHRSVRQRFFVVALILALAGGTVAAEAMPAPAPPSPRSSPSPSSAAPQRTAPSPLNPDGPSAPSTVPAAAAASTTSDAVYAHDAVGRLVGVTDPAGETARYRYDAAGNRLGIDRYASSALSVLSAVPVRAPAGSTLTLAGTGFSTSPASNVVKFGGKTAEVVSASVTRLTVKVPVGASPGKIAVTSGGKTVESTESFTLAAPAPSVSAMDPASGIAGTEVTLSGVGFAAVRTDNVVRFGGGIVAEVTARSDTALTVKVPQGSVSGKLSLDTPDGSTVTNGGFSVISGSGEGDVESSEITSATDTSPPTVAVTKPGNRAQVLFDADQGDDINFGFTNSTFNQTVRLELYTPQGVLLEETGWFSSGTVNWDAHDLPLAGQYVLVLKPGSSNIGAVTVTVSKPVVGVLDTSGPTLTAQITRPGQEAKWRVNAAFGTSLVLGVDARELPEGSKTTLYRPDRSPAADTLYMSASTARSLDVAALSATGWYTVRFEPNGLATGTVRLTASHFADAGTLDPAGPQVQLSMARPGQTGVARFSGTAGQSLSLAISPTTFPGYIEGRVEAPDGSTISGSGFTLHNGYVHDWDSPPLPATGTYTIVIDPPNVDSGTVALTLSHPLVMGALVPNGVPVTAAITRVGQNLQATFAARTGDNLSLRVSPSSSGPTSLVSVLAPSGVKIVDRRFVYKGDTANIGMADLREAGTYRVELAPIDGATGSIALTLSSGLPALTETPAHTLSTGVVPTSSLRTALSKMTGSLDTTPGEPEPAPTSRDEQTPGPLAEPASAQAQLVPNGADAWQPGRTNLEGHAWVTERGPAPAPPTPPSGPDGATALSGRIVKLDGTPLPGVSVAVGASKTRSNAQGQFLIQGIDPRATTLVVDGATANTGQRSYGRFDINIQPQAGRSTDLGFPVWMTPLDTRNTVKFSAPTSTDVVLKTPQIPGLEVRIPKGSVVRDENGKAVTELGITAIPLDRPPFPLPKNGVVPVYFTVQPGGTYVFPKGAQVIYPNYTHEAPGTRVDFMDYDPKAKGWQVYGKGTVSPDGRQVVPDEDTRVWAFHGAMFNIGDWAPWLTSWLKDAVNWLSGDPVELSTGMVTDSRTDLAVSDPLGNAEATRTYWQGDTAKRSFGIGRDLAYNAFLHSEQQYQEVDLYLPGGAKVHFTRTSPGTSWSDAVFEPLDTPGGFKGAKISNVESRWELQFRDGTVWVFPQYAPLAEIRDRNGNKTRITRLNGNKGEITQVTSPGGRWVSFGYDAQHRIASAKDNTGRTVSYAYDSAGRLEAVTDPAGKVSRYTYDGTSNRVATATDARGISFMRNTYDASGRVTEQGLAEGQKYAFEYTQTGTGRVTSVTVTEPGGAVRRVEFDSKGYGTKDTRAHGTAFARTFTYGRDTASNRITAVTDPFGRRTDLQYDANGHITSTTELAGTAQARTSGATVFAGPYDQATRATDALGNATTLTYDASGNLNTITDPEGRTTSLGFRTDGQIAKVVGNDGGVTEYTYRNGDLVIVTDPEGRTSSRFLDSAGRPTVATDAAGAASSVTYDETNQVRTRTDPLGRTTAFAYDENGNLTVSTDSRGNSTLWDYDQADRPKTATDPMGMTARFGYDGAGRINKVINRLGQVATTEYDLLGRTRTTKFGVLLNGQADSTATYDYDAYDRAKAVTETATGTQAFTYDDYDRPATVIGPTGTLAYSFDNADRRTTMTAASITTTYGYDKSSTLTSVKTGNDEVTFGLDTAGREVTASLPGGITRTTGYDKTGVTKSIVYARGARTIGDLVYTRDTRSLQTRLTGSLASIALPAAETGAVYGKDNRISTFNGRSFTYDAEGQLKNDGLRTYTWNTRGELTDLTKVGNPASAFAYGPLGTRIGKTTGTNTKKYLADGSNPVIEQTATGTTAASVASSGLDAFLTRTESGKTQAYLTDALGTVIGLADADGSIAARYAYDPYGTPAATGQPSSNPYTFTGREADAGTGLLYYRARYYDPETGRFISQDPIGQAGGPNLYEYAAGSPTTYTDPTGNNPLLVGCAVGALIDGTLDWGVQRLGGRKVNWGQVGSSAASGCAFGMLGGLGNLRRAALAGCVPGNSFTADTPVLMADGTHKPIQRVGVGDQVLTGDPESASNRPGKVTALIQSSGDEQLVDITVEGKSEPLTATAGHPFWVTDLQRWLPAGELQSGQWLATSSGTPTKITSARHRTQRTMVYNLTVDGPHTYYVGAAGSEVLVHNSTPGCGPHLALGLLHIRGGERNILDSFARRLGAITYTDDIFSLTPGAAMNSDMVAKMIDTVVSRGGYMSFNMKGIRNIDEMVSGAHTYAGNSVTAMELRYICGNAAALKVTTFFNGTAPC
ncbi:RHS repeat-associated core domain-containing protein [Streptomyces sp. NPDC092307]|uniref:RHS repeat-associated core domain-containing protein n=1 Tax=Streptomyces sp. NPDC092307 TaxID=3366013 RepID=UPI00381EB817